MQIYSLLLHQERVIQMLEIQYKTLCSKTCRHSYKSDTTAKALWRFSSKRIKYDDIAVYQNVDHNLTDKFTYNESTLYKATGTK